MTRTKRLCDALSVERGSVVAFVGGGGKTSAILRLSEELCLSGWRVLSTTTTKVGHSMAELLPAVIGEDAKDRLRETLDSCGYAFLAGGTSAEGKFTGIAPSAAANLLTSLSLDVVLVEADGSRQRPIKAPAAHEPVLPTGVDLVVPVAGLDALGRPLDSRIAHRPELVAAICPAARVTPALIAALLASAAGGLKSVPATAAVRPLLNKAYGVPPLEVASIADALLAAGDARLDRVVVADIHRSEFAYARRMSAQPSSEPLC